MSGAKVFLLHVGPRCSAGGDWIAPKRLAEALRLQGAEIEELVWDDNPVQVLDRVENCRLTVVIKARTGR